MSFDDKYILLELSNKIKCLRKRNNLTQMQCLIDTGIHFGRIEQAKRDISFTTLCKICSYFNITLEDFLKDFDISTCNKNK